MRLVVLGFVFMTLIPEGTAYGLGKLGFGVLPLTFAVAAFINVHHYFIDNFIWKIRNPIVRHDLFAHLPGGQRS